MKEIDLADYIHSKKKIPGHALLHRPVLESVISRRKIIMSYVLDVMLIFSTAMMVTFIMEISLKTYMISPSIQRAFGQIPFSELTFALLPIVFFSYHFFSYFFNHGQSWGMSVSKTRIEMEERDLHSSFKWAVFSSTVMLTSGVSFLLFYSWMEKNDGGKFKSHDHLYETFMQEKDISPVNLFELSQNTILPPQQQEEDYRKVA